LALFRTLSAQPTQPGDPVAANSDSLPVGSDFGRAIGDLSEGRPGIIVCSGVRILWSKTISYRNNNASGAIRYGTKECIGTFETP
jgi:hypothetical protein